MKKKTKIKNIITILLCLAMLFTTSSFVYATENMAKSSSEDFIIEDGVLTGYIGEATEVVIPDGVSKIGKYAFNNDQLVESIAIPNTVTEIDAWAFYYCKNLKEINLPNSITEIGEYAFFDCSSLKEIIIPGSVTVVKESIFQDCTNLNYVKLSEGVTTIESKAFLGCENLKDIILPNSLINVTTGVFQGTEWLENNRVVVINNVLVDADDNIQGDLEIPVGVTSIGKNAFYECDKLVNVYIPNSVTRIEEDAFFGCNALGNVYIPSSVTYIAPEAFWLGFSYPDNFVLCAETGSYAQQYVYYDYYMSYPDGIMSYMPVNEKGDDSPYIIPYYENSIYPNQFIVYDWMLEDLSEINKGYPIEIINNINTKFVFSVNTIKETYNKNYDFYGNIITDTADVDIDWDNQYFTKDDFVAASDWFGNALPEEAEISIPLGEKWSGQTIYCYYINVLTDGVTCVYADLSEVVDENGILTIASEVLPNYIFTTKAPKVEDEPEIPVVPNEPTEPDTPNTPSDPVVPEEDDIPVIESYTDTQVVLDVTEKPIIKKEYFEAIVELNKEHNYEIVFHAGDNVYITFEKGTMNMVEGIEDYDFTVIVNPDYNSSKVPAVLGKESFVSKVIYNYSGKLPAMAAIRIPVGTEYAEKTLYYTLLNEDGTFETSQKVVVDKDGYITVKQDHCSSYVITTKALSAIEDMPNTGDNVSIGLWIMLFVVGGVICFIGAKKKNIIK